MRQNNPRRRMITGAMLIALIGISLMNILPIGRLEVAAQGQTGTPNPVVALGLWPRAMAYDGKNTLWITEAFDDTVQRIDINTNQPIGTPIKVWTSSTGISQGLPSAMAYDSNNHNMWVANFGVGNVGSITVVDDKGKVVPTANITGLNRPISVKFAAATMWVLTQTNDQLTRYDPVTYKPLGGPAIVSSPNVSGSFPTTMEYNDRTGTMWVALGNEDVISIIDVKTMKPIRYVPVGGFPIALAFDGLDMWVSHYDFTVWRIDGLTGAVKDKLALPPPPAPGADAAQRYVNLAAGGGHVWVVNGQDASVTDWNVNPPTTKGPVGNVAAGAYAGAAIVAGNYLFVSNWIENTVTRFTMDKLAATPMPSSTPVATNTPEATNTPDICSGLMPQRLVIGQKGFVTPDDPVDLRQREGPSTDKKIINFMKIKETFVVLDGPVCDPPYVWWKVKSDKNGTEGWVAESDKSQDKYFVGPGEK